MPLFTSLTEYAYGSSTSREERFANAVAMILAASVFWSTAVSELAAAGLLAVAATRVARSKGKAFSSFWSSAGALVRISVVVSVVYLLGELLSIIMSPFPVSGSSFSHLWHVLLLPACAVLEFRMDTVRRIGGIFVISGAAASAAAIVGYCFGSSPHLNAFFLGNTTFGDLMVLGAVLAFGSMVAWPASRILPWKSWQFLALVLPLAVAVFLSALRAPVVALVASIFLLTIMHRPRAIVLLAVALGALIMISPLELWLKFFWVAGGNVVDRYVVWKAGTRLLTQIPLFGFGPDSYTNILPTGAWSSFVNRPPSSWHNDFLAIALGSGWQTVIAYGVCLALLVVPGFSAWVAHRTAPNRAEAGMLASLVSVLLFFSMFGSVVNATVLSIVLWVLLGLLATSLGKHRLYDLRAE